MLVSALIALYQEEKLTWTYNTSHTTDLAKVRFIIGDTDNDRQLISDEEINATLSRQSNNLTRTAIEICDHLEAKYVRRAESRSGDIIADFLTVAAKYRELANRLRRKGVKGFAMFYIADRETELAQTSMEKSKISLGEFDNPETD